MKDSKKNRILGPLVFRSFAIRNSITRTILLNFIKRLEGGEIFSVTLRRIFIRYYGVNIGLYTYGGCFSPGNIANGTKIGRYCSFAANVRVFNGNHPLENLSLHPFFYNPAFGLVDSDRISRRRLTIGNDVWIGYGSIILPSASNIGDGAVVGAGSVVTRDVPPFAIVAGSPAQIIRYRFSENRIAELIKLSWWDKPIEELRSNINAFLSPVCRP